MVESMRLDSRLEAEGAEFLVLAHLLIEGVHASKTYTRYPDYDRSFPLSNADTDFLVLVALNRGNRYRRRRAVDDEGTGRRSPELYVFPLDLLMPAVRASGGWSKVRLADLPDVETYKDRWDLIKDWLTEHRVWRPEHGAG